MRLDRRSTRAVAMAFVVATVVSPLGPAVAQTGGRPGAGSESGVSQPDGAVVQSWALSPTGTDPNEPSSRPNLTYEMAPGATTEDSVTLWNYGNTQLTFRIYATDAINNSEGGFDLLTADKAPTDVGSWVTLPQPNITVAARTKVDLPFTLTVPPDAGSGDHTAAILASSEVEGIGPDGKIIKLDRRTGSRLYLRVAGPLRSALAVEELHTAYRSSPNPFGGAVDVSYTVRNVGNVRLGAHQAVALKNPFGKRIKQAAPASLPELLPGGAVVVRVRFEDVTAAVRLATSVTLTPFPVGEADSPNESVAVTRHAWAIPWAAVALVVLMVIGWRAYRARRLRKEWADAGPSGPSAGDDRGLAGIL